MGSYGDFGDAKALTRDFRGKFGGKIFSISEEGTAAAETHVSKARDGAPDFVTHFRSGASRPASCCGASKKSR